MSNDDLPALLISYYYLSSDRSELDNYHFRDWVLDSGAFSALNSAVEIDLEKFTADAKAILASDSKLVEVYSLDIGTWKQQIENAEYMWSRGVRAIPTFHSQDPWEALDEMSRKYEKIAAGGLAAKIDGHGQALTVKMKFNWYSKFFTRVWPVADAMMEHLKPEGVGVVMKAHHSCMGCRGVMQPDAEMITSCLRGAMVASDSARAELLSFL